MTRSRVYVGLALVALLVGWAHLRAIPLARAAQHFSAEARDAKAAPTPSPSAPALRAELRALQAERNELEQEQARRTARADRVSTSLQTLAREAGLDLERLSAQAPGGVRGARSGGPPQLVLVASGDFAQVQRLVRELEGWQGQGRVERLEVALESDPLRPGPLRLELEVRP
ncbi:MAG: hypothetical protein R3F62_23805 [Planctomycetota bacterium]